ncbi:MAG: ribonuclease catalytic domain-containing protein [Betaproteobacteria bacterium]|jgi:exoribonuclease-2|nr:RNB domain-containing ribonuclease [Betaproteobacteria bacterium]
MNVFYEENGEFKVGAVLADNDTSLQVEAPHGKRSKVKASAVLLRFTSPPHTAFMAAAQQEADAIDIDFLWQCCGTDEFGYEGLAADYFGHAPSAVEAAAVLMRLHGAPMYFYKKGRGRYRAASEDALQAALASVERKRLQALAKDAHVAELAAGRMPAAFGPLMDQLLYKPDRNSIEWKALEEAAEVAKVSPARLLQRCGALPDLHQYHLRRFLFEHFPKGAGFPELPPPVPPGALQLAEVEAHSIDDAETTEIDDAFSLQTLPGGNRRLGIHIAAPALGITTDSPLEAVARERLSTVYFPGGKITMLPDVAVGAYTLAAGRECPALSIYFDVAPDFSLLRHETRVERVRIADNLRHEQLEPVFNAAALARGAVDHPQGEALAWLWQFSGQRLIVRKGDAPRGEDRPEFVFRVSDGRVSITRRQRGTPIDQVVAELMILANSTWAADLQAAGLCGLFRVQSGGKVRTSTAAGPHEGLGVSQYLWATSPLRRYTDLVNQRQLMARVRGEAPPYQAKDTRLLAAMRDFEAAYETYAEYQRTMERYWSLRWLLQEEVATVSASVLRENLLRLDALPVVQRVSSLPPEVAAGDRVELAVGTVDLLDLSLELRYARTLPAA